MRRDYSGAWILLATILGSSMAFIDLTAVNVSLPVIQEDLGASITQLQWVIEAYALFLAALLLVGGARRPGATPQQGQRGGGGKA